MIFKENAIYLLLLVSNLLFLNFYFKYNRKNSRHTSKVFLFINIVSFFLVQLYVYNLNLKASFYDYYLLKDDQYLLLIAWKIQALSVLLFTIFYYFLIKYYENSNWLVYSNWLPFLAYGFYLNKMNYIGGEAFLAIRMFLFTFEVRKKSIFEFQPRFIFKLLILFSMSIHWSDYPAPLILSGL